MLSVSGELDRIPLFEEQLEITKNDRVTDRVRVSTVVDERDVVIDDVVERGELTIERVAVERAVAAAPEPRHEGDTLIVSVVEERLVVEKRLFVVEELRVTRTARSHRVSIADTVRTMRANVERVAIEPIANPADAGSPATSSPSSGSPTGAPGSS